jgi:hypothetical protein
VLIIAFRKRSLFDQASVDLDYTTNERLHPAQLASPAQRLTILVGRAYLSILLLPMNQGVLRRRFAWSRS